MIPMHLQECPCWIACQIQVLMIFSLQNRPAIASTTFWEGGSPVQFGAHSYDVVVQNALLWPSHCTGFMRMYTRVRIKPRSRAVNCTSVCTRAHEVIKSQLLRAGNLAGACHSHTKNHGKGLTRLMKSAVVKRNSFSVTLFTTSGLFHCQGGRVRCLA